MSQPLDHAAHHAEYVQGLTGLRGVAALWVMIYHAWVLSEPRLMILAGIEWTPLFSIGWAGVEIFFVLSAYLLSLPFARWAQGQQPRPAAGRYLIRRFLRIFPAYWAQLVVLLVLAVWLAAYPLPRGSGWLAHALLAFHLPPYWHTPMLGVWWTLPTEFLFYFALLPISFLFRPRWGWLLLVALVAAAIAYKLWVFQEYSHLGVHRLRLMMGNTLGYLDAFMVGTLAAWLQVRRKPEPPGPWAGNGLFLLGTAGVLLSAYNIHWLVDDYWAGHVLLFGKNLAFGVSVASLIVATHNGAPLARALLHQRWLVGAGVISYSAYLWHFPVLSLINSLDWVQHYPGYRLPLLLGLGVPAVVLISGLSYRYVERPFLIRRSRRP